MEKLKEWANLPQNASEVKRFIWFFGKCRAGGFPSAVELLWKTITMCSSHSASINHSMNCNSNCAHWSSWTLHRKAALTTSDRPFTVRSVDDRKDWFK